MPQLDTSPWLAILLFSWLVFLTLVPLKVMAHIFPNEPTIDAKQAEAETWDWPLH
uniref:ATP synthase complex subunit 8 n=1 Tax=Tactostoma macropus TaxID=319451 RepID=A0A348B035_9TELE|nr:ATP synthase F0 subunit 8 [Tactostoma macropus]BBD49772.1 ATPase subunit 8 [Tactostoma macropus]